MNRGEVFTGIARKTQRLLNPSPDPVERLKGLEGPLGREGDEVGNRDANGVSRQYRGITRTFQRAGGHECGGYSRGGEVLHSRGHLSRHHTRDGGKRRTDGLHRVGRVLSGGDGARRNELRRTETL